MTYGTITLALVAAVALGVLGAHLDRRLNGRG